MKTVRMHHVALVIAAGVTMTGCMPKMTIAEMKAMMPARPAELDRLNDFVGTWEFTGESRSPMMVEESIAVSGTGVSKWDDSGWFIVGDSVFKMEGFDDAHGHDTWTYDSKSGKYRSTWVDSMGSTGTGVASYCEDSNTWTMKASSHGPFGKTTMKGCMQVVDANTMEWCWTEYAMGGLMKTMEMCGTSKRK